MTLQQAALSRIAQRHIDQLAGYDAAIPLVRDFDSGLQLSRMRDECLHAVRELGGELVRIGGAPPEIAARPELPPELGFRAELAPEAAMRGLLEFERAATVELQELLRTPFEPRTRELLERDLDASVARARQLDGMILRRRSERRVEVQPRALP